MPALSSHSIKSSMYVTAIVLGYRIVIFVPCEIWDDDAMPKHMSVEYVLLFH